MAFTQVITRRTFLLAPCFLQVLTFMVYFRNYSLSVHRELPSCFLTSLNIRHFEKEREYRNGLGGWTDVCVLKYRNGCLHSWKACWLLVCKQVRPACELSGRKPGRGAVTYVVCPGCSKDAVRCEVKEFKQNPMFCPRKSSSARRWQFQINWVTSDQPVRYPNTGKGCISLNKGWR